MGKTQFVCQLCGYVSPKWLGKCPGCGDWNTLIEENTATKDKTGKKSVKSTPPVLLKNVKGLPEERLNTDIVELDRVLGGGIVKGSLILIGGEPGIGKSTLVLQISSVISKRYGKVLYVSGEESAFQTKMRADRLDALKDNLFVLSETNLDIIEKYILEMSPSLVIIDSIQTIYSDEISSASGSVSQVRECSVKFMNIAKSTNTSIILIGHVTKEGFIAGPRVLEHIVDVVLYFEGSRDGTFRVLRTYKNRFGSTNEIAVFAMTDSGLIDVVNPSEVFISKRNMDVTGSVVVSAMEGTRPVLIEIQALTTPSYFGTPQRKVAGFDYNRTALIIAVLEKKLGYPLGQVDIFVSITGGIKLSEPASDLGVALAIASSFKNKPVSSKIAVAGEVGLTGEVRQVVNLDRRVYEAERHGFEKFICPNYKGSNNKTKIKVMKIETINEAMSVLKGGKI